MILFSFFLSVFPFFLLCNIDHPLHSMERCTRLFAFQGNLYEARYVLREDAPPEKTEQEKRGVGLLFSLWF